MAKTPTVKILEAGFQQQIIEEAIACGWGWPDPQGRTGARGQSTHRGGIYHTHDARRSAEGWPDLVMVHPERGLLLFAEVKGTGGKVSLEQRAWLSNLGSIANQFPGSLVYVRSWSPEDGDDVTAVLQGRSAQAVELHEERWRKGGR